MTALGFIIGNRETQEGVVGCHICVSVFVFVVLALSVSLLVTFDIVCVCYPLNIAVSPCNPVT